MWPGGARLVSVGAQVVADTLVGVMGTLGRLRERTGVRAASALDWQNEAGRAQATGVLRESVCARVCQLQ